MRWSRLEQDVDIDYSDFYTDIKLYPKYSWIGPVRAKPRRIYESYNVKQNPEGEHIPAKLNSILANLTKKKSASIVNLINSFGKEANLFDSLDIKKYGKNKASPFEVIVSYGDISNKLTNVGYGVSQSLPLIVEILSNDDCCVSIQQPEVHLHPRAQAALGSFICLTAVSLNNNYIIETHSDFLINRFRQMLSEQEDRKCNAQILFFKRNQCKNDVFVIDINDDGTTSEVPHACKEFFIDEELRNLELL